MNVLEQMVHAGEGSKPFGQMTLDEVKARAAELRSAAGWGPSARVAPVAIAWAELAKTMEDRQAASVAGLGQAAVEERAEKLWIVPPGGSLLR